MITIEEILKELEKHNISKDKIDEVRRAYLLANEIHKNQFRQSGEPYIIHPLSVAKNLLTMEIYDPDTISGALLHDTIEDAEDDFSKEDIARLINPTVAELVDGVSKISKMKFSNKQEQNLANTRKIINGLTKDVRIILIKLADRLHNMRTLQFKKPEKQKENARETMQLFVPLALAIGAYSIKSELEDLSLMYLEPDEYYKIKEEKASIAQIEEAYLLEMKEKLSRLLSAKDIPNDIIVRTKNICTTYKKIKQGYKLENIYDLFYLKILVDEIDDCYRTLAIVHQKNRPINGRFKDYIYNPRTNLYQSLHTTVSDQNGKLIKTKIRTHDMDKVSAFGIPALWNIKDGKTQEETQRDIIEECQFAKRLIQIDSSTEDNQKFIEEITSELLTEHVYVYNNSGEIIELPNGSTAFDYVCHTLPEDCDQLTGILVNGKDVPLDYTLKNNDRVQLLTKGILNPEYFHGFNTLKRVPQKLKVLNGQNQQ